jgi:hypothetical protein
MGLIYREFDGKTLLLVDKSYKGSPLLMYTPDILIISKDTYERCLPYIRVDKEKCKVILIDG